MPPHGCIAPWTSWHASAAAGGCVSGRYAPGFDERGMAMRALRVIHAEPLRQELARELRHCRQARRAVRICSLLLVASGRSCVEAARSLGISARAVELWVHRYAAHGLAGLEEHPRTACGARKLSIRQWRSLARDVMRAPGEFGYQGVRDWSGTTLRHRLYQTYGVSLSARQCRRVLRLLRYRPE